MFWLFLVINFGFGVVLGNKTGCDFESPLQTKSIDSHYKLGVAGNPDLFLPGELYTVSLQGVDKGEGPTPFSGFTIWAELAPPTSDGEVKPSDKTPAVRNVSLGSFQTYDAQSKTLEACEPAVMNATAHSKTEIQIIWNAPKGLEDTCVRLCARAGPATEPTTSWSVLVKTLCPAPSPSTTVNKQPPIVEPCCACDEAKYEVTFESLWSRFTHPRLFPPESYRAHFGDVIGASHTAQYRVWQEGRVASPGIRRLAEDGTTTALEKELKAESEHIRTIIKARGISWQHIGTTGNTASTFAVFRVDARHHLVSLATKLAPSPDWIVGVSALELCNANCTWRNTATIPLYPYDAGMDSGITYTSPREPTIPSGAVRALRPDWPRDPRSPFFNINMEMRPFARLKLNRLRLYEKNCGVTDSGPKRPDPPKPLGPRSGTCETSPWGPWGPCSVSCGAGKSTRQRQYVGPARAHRDGCRAPLTDYRSCRGARMHCRAKSQYEPAPWSDSGACALSPWSEWSSCEGCGVRARMRHYIGPRAFKRCHVGHRARTPLHEAIPCDAGPCHRPLNRKYLNDTGYDWFFVEIGEVNYTSPEPEVQELLEQHETACAIVLTQEEASCEGEDGHCTRNTANEVCGQPKTVGPCRGYTERWFYDPTNRTCEPFGYTGCGGNENNFKSRTACEEFCANYTSDEKPTLNNSLISPNKSSDVLHKKNSLIATKDNEMQSDAPDIKDTKGDCVMSSWHGWGECFGDCDHAIKLNYRNILKNASESGEQCPLNLIRVRNCVPVSCRSLLLTNLNTEAEDT